MAEVGGDVKISEADYQRFVAGMSPEQAARFAALNGAVNKDANTTLIKRSGEQRSHGVYRSKLEADYADRLTAAAQLGQVERWAYEIDTFELAGGYAYTPDFLVRWWWNDAPLEVYVEVKGYMRRHERLLLAIASEEAERRTGYPIFVAAKVRGLWKHKAFRKGMRFNG